MNDRAQTTQTRLRDRLPLAPRREAQFRWRGNEVSRVEGFTDAVFAFAVTLLVVALEVPHTFVSTPRRRCTRATRSSACPSTSAYACCRSCWR